MITPVEKYAEDKRSIMHIIYRLQSTSPGKDYIDDIVHNGAQSDLGTTSFPDNNVIGEYDDLSFSQLHRKRQQRRIRGEGTHANLHLVETNHHSCRKGSARYFISDMLWMGPLASRLFNCLHSCMFTNNRE